MINAANNFLEQIQKWQIHICHDKNVRIVKETGLSA